MEEEDTILKSRIWKKRNKRENRIKHIRKEFEKKEKEKRTWKIRRNVSWDFFSLDSFPNLAPQLSFFPTLTIDSCHGVLEVFSMKRIGKEERHKSKKGFHLQREGVSYLNITRTLQFIHNAECFKLMGSGSNHEMTLLFFPVEVKIVTKHSHRYDENGEKNSSQKNEKKRLKNEGRK